MPAIKLHVHCQPPRRRLLLLLSTQAFQAEVMRSLCCAGVQGRAQPFSGRSGPAGGVAARIGAD